MKKKGGAGDSWNVCGIRNDEVVQISLSCSVDFKVSIFSFLFFSFFPK